MKIVCIGDSLTEGDYGSGISGVANVKSENYPFFLAQKLGCETVNCGKCGYTASAYLDHYKRGNVSVKDADVVLIMLGTNGGLDPDTDTQGDRDYKELVLSVCRDAPEAGIVLILPPRATEDERKVNFGYMPQIRRAREFIRAYAQKEGIAYLDPDACGVFTAENEDMMQPNDGLHFGREGYMALASCVASFLKERNIIQ